MNFDKYISSCVYHHNHLPNKFIIPKIPCGPLQLISFSYLQALEATDNDFCHYSFAFSRISYEWNHTICSLFGFYSLANAFENHQVVTYLSSLFLFYVIKCIDVCSVLSIV